MPAPKGNKFAVGNKGRGRRSQSNPKFIRGASKMEASEDWPMKNNKKHPGGRPNRFKPEYIEQAKKTLSIRSYRSGIGGIFWSAPANNQ